MRVQYFLKDEEGGFFVRLGAGQFVRNMEVYGGRHDAESRVISQTNEEVRKVWLSGEKGVFQAAMHDPWGILQMQHH